MNKKTSEFGTGCVYNLVLFAKHYERLTSDLERYKDKKEPYWSEGKLIHQWFNGASDHLYDLCIPQGWEKKKVGKLLRELQSSALDIGHGKGLLEDYTTKKEFDKIMRLVDEIAMLIDRELGVQSRKAEYG